MRKLDRLNVRVRMTDDGVPTQFAITLQQRTAEAIEGMAAIGDLPDLAGGATLADVIAAYNALLATVRAIP